MIEGQQTTFSAGRFPPASSLNALSGEVAETRRAINRLPLAEESLRAPSSFWAKITGNAAMAGASNRWQYSWTEQKRTSTGWADLEGGRTGTTSTNFALNSVEANNNGTGVEGNSVDRSLSGYPAGFAMKPAQGSPVVRMWIDSDSSSVWYSFEYVNAEDGTCT